MKTAINRQAYWDIDKALRYGETFESHPLLWELAGPDGAHYHLWFKPGTKLTQIREVFRRLSGNQDLVSGSYDFYDAIHAEG